MSTVKHLHNFTIGELLPVKEFDRSKHYVKVIEENKKHRSVVYKEGLNVDIKPFNDDPTASGVEGGIYFTTLEFLPLFYYKGRLVAELTIPEDAKLILDPSRNKYGADKINIIKFWDVNDFLEYVGYTKISCAADFPNLTSARGLEHLESIGGPAFFYNLKSAEGLESLRSIGSYACFDGLETARGLKNLRTIGGCAYFDNLTSAEGLKNLKSIGGTAFFNKLEYAEGLNNLKGIGEDAYFTNIETISGLDSLESIGDTAYFNKLPKEEVMHIKIGGDLYTKEGWNE